MLTDLVSRLPSSSISLVLQLSMGSYYFGLHKLVVAKQTAPASQECADTTSVEANCKLGVSSMVLVLEMKLTTYSMY